MGVFGSWRGGNSASPQASGLEAPAPAGRLFVLNLVASIGTASAAQCTATVAGCDLLEEVRRIGVVGGLGFHFRGGSVRAQVHDLPVWSGAASIATLTDIQTGSRDLLFSPAIRSVEAR